MTEGFEEFLRERREHAERTRRLLVGVLGVACVALAVSNVVLALRLTAVRARPAAEAPAPSASIRSSVEGPPPPVTLPTTSEPPRPEPAEPRSASVPADEPARPATPPPGVPDRPSPVIELPPRPFVGSAPARRVLAPRATAPVLAPPPAAPEQATAAWMLTTYGRGEAESRAQAALEFYDADSAVARYWRRVLVEISAAR